MTNDPEWLINFKKYQEGDATAKEHHAIGGGRGFGVGAGRGNPNRIQTAEQVWEWFVKYREHIESNPIKEQLVFSAREGIRKTSIDKMRAMTWQGFARFMGVTFDTVMKWKQSREDLKEVLAAIKDEMFDQKFTGAAAGVLNHSIIARELGLTDKKEIAGANAGPVSFTIEPVKSGTFLPPTEAKEGLHPSATDDPGSEEG
ncbi:terminase small subunit [Paracoccus methylarcula]|uniref:Terminase small subunit n=1 Tax=Paracoccus methylarcula TaxID=72022 RepID=A0A3R7MA31_9RHOB|nr:terminase small subunit [Paracoccus methylarcula]RNF35337.1 hypothetical protein A7A09_007005 [Paracoccus methylarcula]